MTIVPISEFGPDRPDIPSEFSDTIFNVLPLTVSSYAPLPGFSPFSSPLSARCQGAISISDFGGNVSVFAGDQTKLYRIGAPGLTVSDVSKLGGYTTSAFNGWNFTIHGQRVIATNGIDAPQSYVEGTSTLFSNLITSGITSLTARYAAVIKSWLFLAHTNDSTFGAQPQRVWWGAVNDPTNFPTPGSTTAANNLSGYTDSPGPHGEIKGIVGNLGTSDGAVFYERAVQRVTYSGVPIMFDLSFVQGARGLLASGGLNQYGSYVAYPTEDGFYMFDGSNSLPIGKGKIDNFFYQDLDSEYIDRVCSCSDPSRGLLIWAYPGVGSLGGVCNRLLIYSQALNRWTATEANDLQIEYIMRGATFGTTLEQLDTYSSLENVPYSLDSPIWTGNRSILAAFSSGHEYGFFDGDNMAAKVDTSEIEISSGRRTGVTRIRPLVDSENATISMLARESISSPLNWSDPQAQEPNGSCAVRSYGRYHRARIQTDVGDDWTQISGIDAEEVKILGAR